MLLKEFVNIGAVDVDFAADFGEGEEALVTVVLPSFRRDTEEISRIFGFEPVVAGATALIFLNHVGQTVKFLREEYLRFRKRRLILQMVFR